jgi:hypothetical protein
MLKLTRSQLRDTQKIVPALVGSRGPCSQPYKVRTDTPNNLAKSVCEPRDRSPNLQNTYPVQVLLNPSI